MNTLPLVSYQPSDRTKQCEYWMAVDGKHMHERMKQPRGSYPVIGELDNSLQLPRIVQLFTGGDLLLNLLDGPHHVQSLACLTSLSVDGPECTLAQVLVAHPFLFFAELTFLCRSPRGVEDMSGSASGDFGLDLGIADEVGGP